MLFAEKDRKSRRERINRSPLRSRSVNRILRKFDVTRLCAHLCGVICFSVPVAAQQTPDDTSPTTASRVGSGVDNGGIVDADRASHAKMVRVLGELNDDSVFVPRYGESGLQSAQDAYSEARKSGNVVALLKSIYDLGRELTFAGQPDKGLEVLALSDIVLEDVADRVPPGFVRDFEVEFFLAKGIAALRKAENENCVHCQDGAGCLFPIQGKGVHQNRDGSTMAVDFFERVLKRDPTNVTATWLLNIAQMTLGNHPQGVPESYRIKTDRLKSPIDFPPFPNVAHKMSLDTLSMAGGAIADDFDGDNDLDIIVSDWHTSGQIRFYRNDSHGNFTDATEEANLTGILGGLNVKQADFDNDGDIDVLVLRGAWLRNHGLHPNSLLRNDGQGRFTDVAYAVGIAGEGLDFPTQTAAWADYDRDGDLDMLVGNEEYACQLFENEDGERFRNVAAERGLNTSGFTKGVAWGDIDEDGYPDLYLSHYRQPNRMLKNDAGKRFVDITDSAGVAGPVDSFAVWFWDFNNDGHLDLYCPGYTEDVRYVASQYLGIPDELLGIPPGFGSDALYEGDGSGRFRNVTRSRGLIYRTQTMGCNYGDLNNDGFLDFYLGTGYPGFEALTPNAMYLNVKGKSFVDVSIAGGFSHLQKGHAIAFADFDQDGDQDVFAELGGAYVGDAFHNAFFENPGFGNHWIKIRLSGVGSNRRGVGAKLTLTFREDGQTRSVYQWVGSGGSFGSNPLTQHVGVGKATTIDELRVDWPIEGSTQTFHNLEVNRSIEIREFATAPTVIDSGRKSTN